VTTPRAIEQPSLVEQVTLGYVGAGALALLALYWLTRPDRHTYLLDFYCFRPPNRMRVDPKEFIDGARRNGVGSFCFFTFSWFAWVLLGFSIMYSSVNVVFSAPAGSRMSRMSI
jgi:hypothetical protein